MLRTSAARGRFLQCAVVPSPAAPARIPARALAAALTLALALAAAPAPAAAPSSAGSRAAAADSLYRKALARLEDPAPDVRRAAAAELDQATRLDPGRPELWLALARASLDAGHRERARECFERIAALRPDDAGAQLALGIGWRWEWLCSLEPASFNHSARCLGRAVELEPGNVDAWLALASLALARGDAPTAAGAALRALGARSDSPEAMLALACAAYRMGRLRFADSLFRAGCPRLPPELRGRFERPASLLGVRRPAGGVGGSASAAVAAADGAGAFWAGLDPDLTTPENEAELDFMARLAHALLLFRDRDRVLWDARTEMAARYGLPASIDYEPDHEFQFPRHVHNPYLPEPIRYPFTLQRWHYPALGMQVELWDRLLTQSYALPVAEYGPADPRPDPRALAGRTDLVVMGDGRGVFRAMPPGAHPFVARTRLARFPIEGGARLVAYVAAPGRAADSLVAWWAVAEPDGPVVARGSTPLGASVCDPAGSRAGEMSVDLPPGDYRVDVAVSGRGGARALVHAGDRVVPPPEGLALSDIVLACGEAATQVDAATVRLGPRMEDRIDAERSLTAYFEIAHLALDADGRAHFECTYRVTPHPPPESEAEAARRTIQVVREDSQAGPLRRQFLSVPLPGLADGDYDLMVAVRDRVAGTRAETTLRFTKGARSR